MELAWGRTYVMVEPTHFRVEYVINPFMDPADQPDPERAMAQWRELVATIERCGGIVSVLPQRADAPDMVYAMNLGLGVVAEDGTPQVVMSHMRYPQRRMEIDSAQPWFAERGFVTSYVGREGVGALRERRDRAAAALDRGHQGEPLRHRAGRIGLVGRVHERVDDVLHAEVRRLHHHVRATPGQLHGSLPIA